MAINIGRTTYIPGAYPGRGRSAAELANQYILEWEQKRQKIERVKHESIIPPTICFSRKIGVGALEIADMVSKKIGSRVVDKEILDHIADQANLSEKTVALFDEQYPGRVTNFLSFAFGEKSFTENDYTKHLFSAVYSIANLEPTIFVGRGAHLILPRDRVLAIRVICSDKFRVERLSKILNEEEDEVEEKLGDIDREQGDFFKRVYGLKNASPYEFDMVVNCDYIKEPAWAAEIIALAFKEKYS